MTIRESIGEALSQGLCRGIAMTGWEAVENPLGGAHSLRTCKTGQPLVLLCSPETVGLQFLRHAWSGAVRITTDEGNQILSLSYDEGTDVVLFELSPHSHDFQVTVEALPVAGREEDRCEAWLLSAVFSDIPRPLGRSVLLNAQTKVVYGDWGEFLVLANDAAIPNAIVREGSWAPGDIKLFKRHVRPGDLVLDIGANFGHHSVVFSKLVGSTGLVIAVEAQWVMYQLIHANSVLNRRENIIPLHAAAGAEHGSVTMHPISSVTMFPISYEGENNYGSLGIDSDAAAHQTAGEKVAIYPLDDLLPDYIEGRRVAFVKIDVQSYELFVLQGMTTILKQDRPTILIEIAPYWMERAGYHYIEIYTLLRQHGYRFIHREGTALGPDGIPDVPLDQDIEWDLLAVHPERPS